MLQASTLAARRTGRAALNQPRLYATHATTRSKAVEALLVGRPDDVVITLALRTAMTKGKKGSFKDTSADSLLYAMLKAANQRSGVNPALVQDIVTGVCHSPSPTYEARAAAIAAGFPDHVPVQAINRLCSSGLMAVRSVSDSIARGDIDIGLAVGYESMSTNPRPTPQFSHPAILTNQTSKDCAEPMGWTSENVATDFNISRQAMDEYALLSHTRAAQASASGRFKDEIVPVETTVLVPKDPGNPKDLTDAISKTVNVTVDEGLRPSTMEGLSKLKSAFPQWGEGKSTAGNSSPITDGAAAVLLMRRSKAEELGLEVLARHVTTAVTGVAPRHMGISPSYAIPDVLKKAGIKMSDVDLFEVNEAFASMMVYCINKLGLPLDKLNVNGGAIALGHPLGCTGARQIATGLSELKKRDQNVLLTSMCIGSGMGAAAVFVRESTGKVTNASL
ncbi:thiolase [Cantharellus anzutake]|uniref:thiolase n=1 Tax=Cantharellus anzutake TaxID=1750568 RepID=UPI0019030E7F|nr:thiolase [Cantharellus anzutake]KAF8342885.1 thiolase [Cantharellus anzutake]